MTIKRFGAIAAAFCVLLVAAAPTLAQHYPRPHRLMTSS
jgi:hypothetical protein